MIELDRHAGLDSPIHRLEPRCRLVGSVLLIAGFAAIRSATLLLPMLAVAVAFVVASRIPLGFVARSLRAPMAMVFALGLVLIVAPGGDVVARLGPVAIHSGGLSQVAIILAKLAAIAAVALVLFGAAPLATTVVTMRRLGLPAMIADMAVLSFRALREISVELITMRTAAGMRGMRWRRPRRGAPSRLETLARMVGSLFVISHARAEQVHRAMLLRGYCGDSPLGPPQRVDTRSALFVLLAAVASVAFVLTEWQMRLAR